MAALAAPGGVAAGCAHGRVPTTTLTLDGNLYAVVRGERERYVFGGSGPYVLSIPEAVGLVRKLRFRGTNTQLARLLLRSRMPGADFIDGGSLGDFTFTCRGGYRATALVRREGRGIVATRFWLRQGESRVTRAFCMPEQWLPAGALVSVSFRVPLASKPPVFTVDWDGNGTMDSVGPFRAGGARFPISDRC